MSDFQGDQMDDLILHRLVQVVDRLDELIVQIKCLRAEQEGRQSVVVKPKPVEF